MRTLAIAATIALLTTSAYAAQQVPSGKPLGPSRQVVNEHIDKLQPSQPAQPVTASAPAATAAPAPVAATPVAPRSTQTTTSAPARTKVTAPVVKASSKDMKEAEARIRSEIWKRYRIR